MPATLQLIAPSATHLTLTSAEVQLELNQHGWCFAEFRATSDNRPRVEEWLGQPMTVEARDETGAKNIFEGIVWQAELHHDAAGGYNAALTGVTRSWVLECTHDQNLFKNKTLTTIARDLASNDDVEARVNVSDDSPFEQVVQWGDSDLAFLARISYERKAWIRPTANGVEVRDTFESGAPIKWADRLVHYAIVGRIGSPSFSGTHYDPNKTQSKTFRGVTFQPAFHDSNPMATAVVSASQAVMPSGRMYRRSHAATAEEFRQRLEVESLRSLSNVYVIGVSREFRVGLGNELEIQELRNGDGNGKCGVVSAIHTWTQAAGYKNQFVATLAKQWVTAAVPRTAPPGRVWQVPDRPGLHPTGPWSGEAGVSLADPRMVPWDNSGRLSYMGDRGEDSSCPPSLGVVVARVTNNNDPAHQGRLKVQYIWADEETDWIRMSSPSAGADRGIMFLPEVGDEVLVAFEDGDSNRPIVIGSLWNRTNSNCGVRKPFKSQSGIDNNDVKRIVTKCGHTITLCDTPGEQAITIRAAFNSSIKILEKHPETGFPMIAFDTPDGDIILSAPSGRVHVNSKFYSREVG